MVMPLGCHPLYISIKTSWAFPHSSLNALRSGTSVLDQMFLNEDSLPRQEKARALCRLRVTEHQAGSGDCEHDANGDFDQAGHGDISQTENGDIDRPETVTINLEAQATNVDTAKLAPNNFYGRLLLSTTCEETYQEK